MVKCRNCGNKILLREQYICAFFGLKLTCKKCGTVILKKQHSLIHLLFNVLQLLIVLILIIYYEISFVLCIFIMLGLLIFFIPGYYCLLLFLENKKNKKE